MVKIKEIHIWIVFFVLVIAGALYLRYYYQPSISLNLSFVGNDGHPFYPYEQVSVPISVQNTGSSEISDLSFGLYTNNNLTRTYKMTIPAGKAATVDFNFTPTSSGTYKIAMIADPNNLYNIQNRKSAEANLTVVVSPPEKPEPQVLFSAEGLLGEDLYQMSTQGFAAALFLFNSTGANQFSLTQSQKINDFIYPALDVYYNYINKIAVGHAYYKNYSLVSIWLSGYLTPSALETVAVGKGLNITTVHNITEINFGGNTTMCTWYSNGWVKSLAVINGGKCTGFVAPSNYLSINSIPDTGFIYKNSSIYNYTGRYQNYSYTGQWAVANGFALFQSVERGSNFTNVCYGTIVVFSNISYCNTYYIEPQNTIIAKTNALLGSYNFTTWELSSNLKNTTQISSYDANLIKSYNITAPSAAFVSGFVNTCYINTEIGCYDTLWNYSTLGIGLINSYNSSVHLTSIGCFVSGTPNYTIINQTLMPGQYTYVHTNCYRNGTVISGVPLGLNVYLDLRYEALNRSVVADGDAKLVH